MKRLLNITAWIIVSIILSWFYSCMKQDTEKMPAPKLQLTPAKLKVIKTCGTLKGVIIRGTKVFCENGQPVENVNGNDLEHQP